MTNKISKDVSRYAATQDKLDTLRSRALAAQNLSARERQILNFSIRSMTISKIAELLGIEQRAVRAIQANIRKKVGVTTKADLSRVAALSQVRFETTPALALYEWTYEHLINARILGAVVQDEDWFGLLLEMQNGDNRIAWFVTGLDGEHSSGWIELE